MILFAVALGVLTACDPIKDEDNLSPISVSESQLDGCLSVKQNDASGNPAADGNYFYYVTSPATTVSVFRLLADGSESLLSFGTSGSFVVSPKRGSDPNQDVYFRVVNSDGTSTIIKKTFNVYVQQELEPEIRLLASDEYGKKKWFWDPTVSGAVWGNMGYCGGKGSDVGLTGNGQWWGVGLDESGELSEFMNQLNHTPDGNAHGDESIYAYMEIDDEGFITCFDKDNKEIRKGTYTVEGYDPSNPDAWRVGLLKTRSILWPYEINSGGNIPGEYEIVYLTPDKMTLVYPDGGAYSGLGSWGEATFWHFASPSDINGMAVGYGKSAQKSWTWDNSVTGAVWGNMGYCGGKGSDVGLTGNGQWWGCTSEEDFAGQTQHSGGSLHGDESFDAYFTLSADGIITRVAGNGTTINSGTFHFVPNDEYKPDSWTQAQLNTTAGTILWPYEINSGGNMPTVFDVVYLTNDKMTLVYPDKGEFNVGSWGEASFWHFKAK